MMHRLCSSGEREQPQKAIFPDAFRDGDASVVTAFTGGPPNTLTEQWTLEALRSLTRSNLRREEHLFWLTAIFQAEMCEDLQ